MADVRWKPLQRKTAQVSTVAITGYDVTTTYRVTCNGKIIGQIGTGGSATTTAAALQALLAAQTAPEFTRITWTTSTINVIGTAKIPGVPFTITVSVSGGAGTISLTATTANQSPNDVGDALNYSAGSLPVNGDALIVDAGDVSQSMWWNLGALSGVTLAGFYRRKSFKGKIGLPEINRDGLPYSEYFATELAFGLQSTFNVFIEQPTTDRAEHIKINTGTTQTILTIQGDSPGSLNNEALWWRGTHASNVVNNEGGSLAVGVVNNNPATIATLNNRGTTRLGNVVTQGIINNFATLQIGNTVTTFLQQKGRTTAIGDAINGTAWTVQGGTLDYRGTGTVATVVIGSAGVVDCSKDNRARVFTNTILMYRGATLKDPAATLLAGGIDIQAVGCLLRDLNVDIGPGRTITVT